MAGLEASKGGFTNLKIEVPNDLQVEEGELSDEAGDTRMEEDELEEGEASEDEVEVNVIIGEDDAGRQGRAAKESFQLQYDDDDGLKRVRRLGVTDPPNLHFLGHDTMGVRCGKCWMNRVMKER
ncbi:hypothetical protein Hamer_G002865 [Homarus americanus]|uniref:Uncharacterized protein n=1 Tax=Homarus americanus TaxID=6706 RepID=A0A8J5K265_HOMAM|nr:hypothetical protein Hamer_G002865 [Homarus americanus]